MFYNDYEIYDNSLVIKCKYNKERIKLFFFCYCVCLIFLVLIWFLFLLKVLSVVNSCYFSIRWLFLKYDGGWN